MVGGLSDYRVARVARVVSELVSATCSTFLDGDWQDVGQELMPGLDLVVMRVLESGLYSVSAPYLFAHSWNAVPSLPAQFRARALSASHRQFHRSLELERH